MKQFNVLTLLSIALATAAIVVTQAAPYTVNGLIYDSNGNGNRGLTSDITQSGRTNLAVPGKMTASTTEINRSWATGTTPAFSWSREEWGIDVTADTTFTFANLPTDTNVVRYLKLSAIGNGTHQLTNTANTIIWHPTYPGILPLGTNDIVFQWQGGLLHGFLLDQLLAVDGLVAQINKRQTNVVIGSGLSLVNNTLSATATASEFDPSTTYVLYDDFISGSGAGDLVWTAQAINAGSVSSDSEGGHPSYIRYSTGVNNNGGYRTSKGVSSQLFGGGVTIAEANIRIPTLSDGTETFTVYFGWMDVEIGSAQGDAVYITYTHGANSGNWVANGVNATTASTSNLTGGPSANTWYRMRIVVAANGSSFEVFQNGTSIGTHSSNIPTGAGRSTGPRFGILKSAGTTARTMDIDYVFYKTTFTTPR